MRKRINLQVDKLIAKPNKKIKEQPQKNNQEKPLSFQQLYQMARKASSNANSRMASSHNHPKSSNNTSQQRFQSLKNSRQTPQNTNRQPNRVSQKLNRSLQTKRQERQKMGGSVRSFSGGKYQSSQKNKFKPEEQTNLKEQRISTLSAKNGKKKCDKVNTYMSEGSLFESQFKQQINKLNHNKHEHLRQTQCFLSIEETYQIMKGLNYLRKIQDQKYFVKIWQELQGEGYGGVPSGNLFQFCTFINNYSPNKYYQKQSLQKNGNSICKKIIINGNLKIVASESSKLQIYEQYLALRVNRILYGNTATDYSPSQKTLHRTSNIKIIDDEPQPLQKEKQENNALNQKRKISFKKKNEENSLQNPIKRTVRLKSTNNPKTKKNEQNIKCQEIEKSKAKYQESINEGLETRQSKNALTSNESVSSINSTEICEQSIERKPLLSIDVNLGEGVNEKLVVYEGQSAADVSQRLVDKYKIDDSLRVKFEGMLSGHLRNLLWRIQEVSEDMFSDRQQ